MSPVLTYFIRVGDATSQWLNVVLFFSDNPNESISGRAYRQREVPVWRYVHKTLDLIFWVFKKEHCRLSYEADVVRANKTIEEAS